MTSKINRDVAVAVASLTVLLALYALHATSLVPSGSVAAFTDELVTTLSNRDLNKEGREALTAGYYEGLINEGSRLGMMNRLVTDTRQFAVDDRDQPDRRRVDHFRFYELLPNAETPDYHDERFRYVLKTNSVGMADKEYALAKPPGVYRLALLGDSITRGQGAPFQRNYEALLEERLNAAQGVSSPLSFEILNFAVGSYSVMQMMDTAIDRATPFNPDVYVVALTDLSVYRSWGHHIALLLNAGIDLKYDYLRTLVRDAGLKATDPRGVADAKLARFRIPTIRWALAEMKAHAAREDAALVVLLVPTADDPALLEEEFLGVRQMLREIDVPVVDALGTFAGVADRSTIRVAESDRHPNAAGHKMLFETIFARIMADSQLREIFVPQAIPPTPAEPSE